MNETSPVHDAEYFRAKRVVPPSALSPEPIAEKPMQIKPPQIRHYGRAAGRPIVTTTPAKPLRVTRADIERALHGANNGNPATAEIVDRIVLEVARMDGFADGSPPFKAHHETMLRLLREIGLYPI